MTSVYLPQRLHVAAFAKDSAQLAGHMALSAFPRLALEASRPSDVAARWSARGELRSSAGEAEQVWLHLEASMPLPMVCQRAKARNDLRWASKTDSAVFAMVFCGK